MVAKCGVFLKEKGRSSSSSLRLARGSSPVSHRSSFILTYPLPSFCTATEIEGIFRLSGSEKRIKELKTIFDSPDRYGKGLVWDGYTVHDAANVLRRYLNDLPEPVVPLHLYEKFREPLRGATKQAVGDADGPQFVENFDMDLAITRYQQLITELPPLNRQLLLYILDLLAVFAAKAEQNRMNSQNLAAIFQPGMLSHPSHAMAPEEYRLNQCVIIFLIENQDHFLIGMQGTAADENTVRAVQKGETPAARMPPSTPIRSSGVVRTASNASAGAESVAKDGQVRRNKSVSSRRSRHSNGAPSPGSPAVGAGTGGGLSRSNTVPSKKSPALQTGRLQQRHGDHSSTPIAPLTPVTPSATTVVHPPALVEEIITPPADESEPNLPPGETAPAPKTQETLLEPTPEVPTPSKERKLPILFQRSPTGDSESLRQPNKLRKKKFPNSANPSAQSSTASLPHSAASPSVEISNPLDRAPLPPAASHLREESEVPPTETPSELTPRASVTPAASGNTLHPQSAEHNLKPKKSPPSSIHSSFNEGSDLDQVDEPVGPPVAVTESQEKEKDKKKRWRLSRRKEELSPPVGPIPTSPQRRLGTNAHAEVSSSTVESSGYKPRRSFTGESSDPAITSMDGASLNDSMSKEGKEDGKGLAGWIKNKVREHNLKKENKETEKRNKSPSTDQLPPGGGNAFPTRGKSVEIMRNQPDEEIPASEEEKSPK